MNRRVRSLARAKKRHYMRLAIISDIHGNAVALKEVLDDIRARSVDEMVCLGDIVTLGAEPGEVLDLLESVECRFVLGNHDEFIYDPSLMDGYIKLPIVGEAIRWCLDRLTGPQKRFFDKFEKQIRIDLEDGGGILLYHGSPRSNFDDILSFTPDADVDRLIDGNENKIMIGGHTHIQMLRLHHGNMIVNAGSVGFPFREYVAGGVPSVLSCAQYVIVETANGKVSINFITVDLDRKKLLQAAERTENPMRHALIALYR